MRGHRKANHTDRAAVLRRREQTRVSSASDDEAGGLHARSAASEASQKTQPPTPCRATRLADRLALVTATNSGQPMPERDDAAQPGSTESSSQAATTPPDPSPAGKPTVTIDKPILGAIFDRIPVHKVSPLIEGGAYPAKAVVGESIPIRATVFREGHDAVNASVVLTDPAGNERLEPMRPTTPLGFDWWTASVVLETEGSWTFRVEGWSDPWATWVHNAEIKIPGGIDVALVCTEGSALFERSAADAEAAGDARNAALLRAAA